MERTSSHSHFPSPVQLQNPTRASSQQQEPDEVHQQGRAVHPHAGISLYQALTHHRRRNKESNGNGGSSFREREQEQEKEQELTRIDNNLDSCGSTDRDQPHCGSGSGGRYEVTNDQTNEHNNTPLASGSASAFACGSACGSGQEPVHESARHTDGPTGRFTTRLATLAAALNSNDTKIDNDTASPPPDKARYLPLSRTTDRVLRILLSDDLARVRAESVAETLGMSCTTLRRRLRADHTNYQFLLDRARQYRCERVLQSRWRPGKCLADELGYLEVNSFYRAFRRWTGVNYSDYKMRYCY